MTTPAIFAFSSTMWIKRTSDTFRSAIRNLGRRAESGDLRQWSYRIAYAAMNDADLMIEVARYLRTIGAEAQLFLDSRSDPAQAALLQAKGVAFEYVDNEHGFVEGVYGKIAARTDEEWLLILTSDEIPTRATLAATERLTRSVPQHINSIGFPRRWVLRSETGRFFTSRAAFIGDDPQWRVIRHRNVEFHPVVHTPGYQFDEQRSCLLEPEAAVYHLDWVVHSRELRERKLRYYDRMIPGAAEGFKKWYLPEDYPDDHAMEPLTDPGVLDFAERSARLRTSQGWSDRLSNESD
ncbi:hypothetical protein JNW90_12020 [Micromonospora sp. STR1s_5]|nr:hypothetical protein [Micromonospora sp. STR1s_5]